MDIAKETTYYIWCNRCGDEERETYELLSQFADSIQKTAIIKLEEFE